MHLNTATFLQGDCAEQMKVIPDGSIHLVVTSPPYDALRSYNGHNLWDFEATAKQLFRVLCKGGILCWNVGDSVVNGSETLTSCKQKIFFVEQCGFRCHDTMIYEKTNFGHPEKVRYHQLFEYVFIFSKGVPRCFNPIRDKKNVYAGTGTWGRNSVREANGEMSVRKRNLISEFGMRGNVWRGKTSGQERGTSGSIHPAKMPDWLASDLIRSWSNEGDTVLDPFSGSGTTGVAALKLRRDAVLIDADPACVKLSREMCQQVAAPL